MRRKLIAVRLPKQLTIASIDIDDVMSDCQTCPGLVQSGVGGGSQVLTRELEN